MRMPRAFQSSGFGVQLSLSSGMMSTMRSRSLWTDCQYCEISSGSKAASDGMGVIVAGEGRGAECPARPGVPHSRYAGGFGQGSCCVALNTICARGSRSGPRRIVWPPSQEITWPVIHDDSGPMRKRTRPAMSSVVPRRRERHLVEVVGVRLRVVHEPCREIGGHEAGAHGVHAHARAAQLVGGVAHEHFDRGLRDAVRRHPAMREDACDRGDRDASHRRRRPSRGRRA